MRVSQPTRKQQIAILGGGMAACVAAFELTSRPDWRSRYGVTLYQMGFRLGGKGASSRNRQQSLRIEEHGLHVWGGHYDNAFHVIRRCYEELNRSPTAPLATWDQAFKKRSFFTLEEHVGDHWISWNFKMPENDAVPGDEPAPIRLGEIVKMAFRMLQDALAGEHHWKDQGRDFMPRTDSEPGADREVSLEALFRRLQRALFGNAVRGSAKDALRGALDDLRGLLYRRLMSRVEANDHARRSFLLADFALAHLRGILLDRVISRGWDALDDEDWAEWLRKHGASAITLESPLVRGMYDLYFAYPEGDTKNPQIAAGSVVYTMLRFLFAHKGSPFWEMQGGMGDVVFAPLYEVLRRRGVRFEFFHEVTNLGVSGDGRSIESIRLVRQARLRGAEYAPLIDVKGLPCWPAEPLYGQLESGSALEQAAVDFERPWPKGPEHEVITLRAGTDFDVIVLGIAIGALRSICPELIAASERWRAMIHNLTTVQTQAIQLWFKPDTRSLGWTAPRTILCGYAQPFNTWADMSHTIKAEAWPEGTVGSIAYFCGPMQEISPGDDADPLIARANPAVKRAAVGWLKEHPGHLFRSGAPGASRELCWNELVAPESLSGERRFDAQYHRGNVSPSDRYVLSIPGTKKYRLAADGSGFENLYLVGDWVKNAYSLGTIEAATITGRKAARAISGFPSRIFGDDE